MRSLFVLVSLAACTDPSALGVTDLATTEIDMNLGAPTPAGNPGNFYLRGAGCTPLAADVTASFDGFPGIVSRGGAGGGDYAGSPGCEPPMVFAPKLPGGDALLLAIEDPTDRALMIVAEPFARRTVAWEHADGKLVPGQPAAIVWDPPTDRLGGATVTCASSDVTLFEATDAERAVAQPPNTIPLAIDGARLSFVVPDVATHSGAVTCSVTTTAHPQIVECTGLGACTAEIATPTDLTLQATL